MAKTLEELKDYLPNYLEAQGLRITRGNACPICGGGEQKRNVFHYYAKEQRAKCFACGFYGDIFDLIAHDYGLNNTEAIQKARELYDGAEPIKEPIKEKAIEQQETDYSESFREWSKNANRTDYFKKRGLSPRTVDRFMLGYCENWKHPNAPDNVAGSPRAIIPTSRCSYIARDTREEIPSIKQRYAKQKTGHISLFNTKALENSKEPLFITEGEFDALSFIEIGFEAVGLGSTTKAGELVEKVEQLKSVAPLIIATDTDQPGEKCAQEIIFSLQAKGHRATRFHIPENIKDPNEYLIKDRKGFMKAAREAVKAVLSDDNLKDDKYIAENARTRLESFFEKIQGEDYRPTPTGFRLLDEKLGGGLLPGLVVIGAPSSMGKTTFTQQIVENIAREQGRDVFVFALEMSADQVISKSLSRLTWELTADKEKACSSVQILKGYEWQNMSKDRLETIQEARETFETYAKNIYIFDVGHSNINEIINAAQEHKTRTGSAPLLVVDYLQILAPCEGKSEEVAPIVKDAVKKLKDYSISCDAIVFAVTAFNRASANTRASLESSRDTSGIEYSSDYNFSLTFSDVENGEQANIDELKRKDPRDITLKILKNRLGATGERVLLEYRAAYNHFTEAEEQALKAWNEQKPDILDTRKRARL